MLNGYDEMMAFGKDNIEALVKSGAVATKGFEQLSKLMVEYQNQSVQKANAATKALTSCKSPVEFMQVQSQLAKDGIETMVVDTRKVTELMTAIVNSAMEPLAARINAFAFLKPAFAA
ncbi:MAG: phasin family protein [Rhodospirillales bacterium]|nr:phasin family protein [Rhodospirillales bacterium]